jgi:cell division protein FtsB
MRNFQKKQGGIMSILQSVPVLMLLGALVIFFAYSMFDLVGKMMETSRNKEIAERQLAELQKSKEKLNTDIAKLNTEQGVDEIIREKFGLVKDGEGMIVIVEDKTPGVLEAESKSDGFFSFFTNWFK